MKRVAQVISYAALAATLLPALLFFADKLDLRTAKHCMLAATAIWFLAAPLWMEHKATD